MAKVKGKKGQDKSKSVEVTPKKKPDSPDERLGILGYLLLCVIFAAHLRITDTCNQVDDRRNNWNEIFLCIAHNSLYRCSSLHVDI